MAEPRLGHDFLTDLDADAVSGWPNFPFKGELQVKTVRPFESHDHVRDGDPGGPPCGCEPGHEDEPRARRRRVWSNGTWEVTHINFSPDRPAPFPAYMLQTVEHKDFGDFTEADAAELGVMTLRMQRAIQAIGGVGRVHFNRWGDGGAHFHVWFLGRPLGAWQLSGFTLPLWGFILPPLDEAVRAGNDEIVRASLAAADGATA